MIEDATKILLRRPRAGRSAEFCPAHFTGQTLRTYVQSTESKSGQRAASGCGTRNSGAKSDTGTLLRSRRSEAGSTPVRTANFPFHPIRPGLNAEPSGYELRFCVAGKRLVFPTAKGIGVRGGHNVESGMES